MQQPKSLLSRLSFEVYNSWKRVEEAEQPTQHTQQTPNIQALGRIRTSDSSNQASEDRRFNLLKFTGHVTHQQFNIQQLYVLPTLYLCVLYLSENKQRLVPRTA